MLEPLNPQHFEQVYQILADSFPSSERRTYKGQKEVLNNEFYKIFVYQEKEKIHAFIAVWDFIDFVFVEHFAVEASHRNEGLGKKMLVELMENKQKTFCLEVEPPETEIARRRIGFYERLGFHLLPFTYEQPAMQTTEKSIPLCLMSYPEELDKGKFNQIKNKLYQNVYHVNI